MSFTDPQDAQAVKGAIHGAVLTLSALCLVYNACAFAARRDPHLLCNVGIYTALIAFECRHVWRHCA